MLAIHARDDRTGQSEAHAAEDRPRRLVKSPRGREHDGSPHAMSLHGVEDVTDPARKDGREASTCGTQRDEDGLLTGDCAVHRGGLEDIALHDARAVDGQASRIASESRDLVTFGDTPSCEQLARLARGPEDNDLHRRSRVFMDARRKKLPAL